MKTIALQIIMLQAILCLASCEKDFVYDDDCDLYRGAGSIGGWDQSNDTTITQTKDTITGGFAIDLNEWGDTIHKEIKLK